MQLRSSAHNASTHCARISQRQQRCVRRLRCRPPRALNGSGGNDDDATSSSSSSENNADGAPRHKPGSVVYRASASTRSGAAPLTFPTEVPLLPFRRHELLTPGATKVLHLYEARYLALLEFALRRKDGGPAVLVHVIVDEADSDAADGDDGGTSGSAPERLRGAFGSGNGGVTLGLATLVQVVEVKAHGVGALVRIQGEGRVSIDALSAVNKEPYLVGTVSPLLDAPVPAQGVAPALEAADELAGTLRECADMCAKFGGAEAAALQQAMLWAERDPPLVPSLPALPRIGDFSSSSNSGTGRGEEGGDGGAGGTMTAQQQQRELERAGRLAWAALSALPQASPEELRQLARARLSAMAGASLSDRLALAGARLGAARAMLAARIALKTLNLG